MDLYWLNKVMNITDQYSKKKQNNTNKWNFGNLYFSSPQLVKWYCAIDVMIDAAFKSSSFRGFIQARCI